MRYLVALLAAGAVYSAVSLPRGKPITARVGRYLNPTTGAGGADPIARVMERLEDEHTVNRGIAAVAGALPGILLAQGDLFLGGPGRSVVALALLGGAAGWLLYGMHRSTLQQRRGRRLRFELPVVADTVALHIIAGESVGTSIERFVEGAHGVAAEELEAVLDDHHAGTSLTEALQRAGQSTADEEAQRLYSLLGHAHDTGGRLADALAELSGDYRAALARDITTEGGKRALAAYGPVLALMVPVALLFLLYPTLAGLRGLAGSP